MVGFAEDQNRGSSTDNLTLPWDKRDDNKSTFFYLWDGSLVQNGEVVDSSNKVPISSVVSCMINMLTGQIIFEACGNRMEIVNEDLTNKKVYFTILMYSKYDSVKFINPVSGRASESGNTVPRTLSVE